MKYQFSKAQLVVLTLTLMALSVSARAQTTATPQVASPAPQKPVEAEKIQPRKVVRRPSLPARVTMVPGQRNVAPQVVTVVHRLSGIKMLRFILRQQTEAGTVAMIDPLSIMGDAHASIIAGWAVDDQTITARLPQAAAEMEFPQFATTATEFPWAQPNLNMARARAGTAPGTQPDLTVITRDGRRLPARYVGLDVMTGLSVLQVNGLTVPTAPAALTLDLTIGQTIQLFAPERTSPAEAAPGIIYVRIGDTEARVAAVERLSSGRLERLTVSATKLTPEVIGGVACDASGNTLGIIEGVDGNNAQIVAAEAVREATRRVLERQASVPRPLLGIRGEPVEFSSRALFIANGWREDRLAQLVNDQAGILLLQVMPGTPAATAALRRGDVILKVNDDIVKSAEDFSDLLSNAGSGEQVKFTVARPDALAPVAVTVKLGATFDQVFQPGFELPRATIAQREMENLGIETVPLTLKAASLMAAKSGLLVMAVEPQSVAARGGVREGDVIEAIDGHLTGQGLFRLKLSPHQKHVLSVVRKREKTQVELTSSN